MLIVFISLVGAMNYEMAEFALFVYSVCPIICFITLFTNIHGMKNSYKGKGFQTV